MAKIPLVKIDIKGHIAWQGEHPIAEGAKKSSSPEHWDHISGCAKKSHPDFKTINLLLKNITSKIDLYLLNAGD
jgi:hypothetical protein